MTRHHFARNAWKDFFNRISTRQHQKNVRAPPHRKGKKGGALLQRLNQWRHDGGQDALTSWQRIHKPWGALQWDATKQGWLFVRWFGEELWVASAMMGGGGQGQVVILAAHQWWAQLWHLAEIRSDAMVLRRGCWLCAEERQWASRPWWVLVKRGHNFGFVWRRKCVGEGVKTGRENNGGSLRWRQSWV